jgi:hypothetical protein
LLEQLRGGEPSPMSILDPALLTPALRPPGDSRLMNLDRDSPHNHSTHQATDLLL